MEQWLDEKNWFSIPTNPEAIFYKKQVFLGMTLSKNNFQTRFNSQDEKKSVNSLCEDIDFCSFILSKYMYQHEKLEKLPNIKKHFDNKKHAQYILSNGLITQLQDILLEQYPNFKEDKDLIIKILKNGSRNTKNFIESFKDYDFVLKCLKNKVYCYEFLELHPKDKTITQKMLKARYYPKENIVHLYNDNVLANKNFILPILLDSNGYFLYDYLPKSLKQDIELCDALKAKHPHVQVEVSSINTVEKFINSLNTQEPFATEIYTIIGNMEHSDFIINDSNAIAQVLIEMGKHECSCYVDLMGDPHFDSHPIQEFLNKIKVQHKDIAAFLKTNEGKKIMNFKVSDYSEFTEFENKILPTIGTILDIYLQMYKLDNSLSLGKKSKNNNHI